MDPRYSLAGLLIGFLIGLTGMGGGSLMTPLLILILGIKPSIAVGSDLAYSAITKIVGGFQHHRQNTVNYKITLRLAAGSVPGSLLGVWCVHRLVHLLGEQAQHLILRLLGIMLILVSLALFVKSHPKAAEWRFKINLENERTHWTWCVLSGLLLGFLVGVTSVGSGTLFGVLMLLVFGLGAREMVGTDVVHAAILTSAAAVGNMWVGNINYSLVGSLILGSVPGVLLGSRLAGRLPEKALRPILACVLLLSGLKMI